MNEIKRSESLDSTQSKSRYRFFLIPPFTLKKWAAEMDGRPKEERLQNYELNVKGSLEDVDWDLHEGVNPPYGDWLVENREEFLYAAAARMPEITKAAESGKYNAIVLLGGGEPGFHEAREACRKHNVVVTANAHAQMYIACMLGNKFSIIDIGGMTHNMYYRNLLYQHRVENRCASIRTVGYQLPRPGHDDNGLRNDRAKALAGEDNEAVKQALEQAHLALKEDGADAIILGCSGVFWLKSFIQKGLAELGWEVPVLDGYTAAIEMAKMMVNLGVNASGVAYPPDFPQQKPTKIIP